MALVLIKNIINDILTAPAHDVVILPTLAQMNLSTEIFTFGAAIFLIVLHKAR